MSRNKTQALLLEAKAYRDLERYPEALENLHQLVEQDSDNPNYLYLLGSTYLESKNVEFAKKYALLTLEKKTDSKEAFELLGLISEAEKKYEEAEKYYLKSLETDPDFFNARFMLIKLYSNCFFPERLNQYQQGYKEVFKDYSKAVEQCNIALQGYNSQKINKLKKNERLDIGMNYCVIAHHLARAYYKEQKQEETIQALQRAVSIGKDVWGEGVNVFGEYINIFKLYHLLGDKKNAEKYLEIIRSQCSTEQDFQKLKKDITEQAENGDIYL